MSTFALVLQLWFTLSNAMQPPKMKTTRRDCFRNTTVSLPQSSGPHLAHLLISHYVICSFS